MTHKQTIFLKYRVYKVFTFVYKWFTRFFSHALFGKSRQLILPRMCNYRTESTIEIFFSRKMAETLKKYFQLFGNYRDILNFFGNLVCKKFTKSLQTVYLWFTKPLFLFTKFTKPAGDYIPYRVGDRALERIYEQIRFSET